MTNSTAAIMALPGPLESIKLVGDEDKHTTLLYFGETSTLPNDAKQTLEDSVAMAASMLSSFSERVRDISRLGSDNPPALVAMLSDRNLSQIRNLFGMNPSVKSYLDNTDQFPSFTPHMTLAYPDFAEEALIRILAKQVYNVGFDRLAVWWNDERIEFPLNVNNEESMAMADEIGVFLEHHGIMGQRWGFRKDAVGIGSLDANKPGASVGVRQVNGKTAPPLDKAESNFIAQHIGIAQHAAFEASKEGGSIHLLNQKVMADFNKTGNWSPAAQAKYEGYVAGHLNDAIKSALKPSGLASHVGVNNGNFLVVVGHPTAVKNFKKDVLNHISEDAVTSFDLVPIRKDPGIIVGFKPNAMGHSDVDNVVESVLEHHGILGQRWGFRRPVDPASGLVSRTSSEDKIRQDRTAKKLAKGGIGSVSNADLQSFTQRIRIEEELNKALARQTTETKAKTDGFIKRFVKSQGGRQIDRVVNKSLDVAVEAALRELGLKVEPKKLGLGLGIQEVSNRLAPKKKDKK